MRTLVEAKLWNDSRLRKLEKTLIDTSLSQYDAIKYCAMGLLVYLWHETQIRVRDEFLQEEIDDLLHPGATAILLTAGFIVETEPGSGIFRVKGSHVKVNKMRNFLAIAVRSGHLSAHKRWGTPIPQDYLEKK